MPAKAKYDYNYSKNFEQFRINWANDREFYYWFTPLCRVDKLDAVDETLAPPVMHKIEDAPDKTIFEIKFKSSLWQEKKTYLIFTPEQVEYFVKVKGNGVVSRVYFFTGFLDGRLCGSVPGFDSFIPGCPNFITKKEMFPNESFSICSHNDTTYWGHALSSGPLVYLFGQAGTKKKIWAGLVVEKGCNIFDSFDFNYKSPEMEKENEIILNTQSFSINYCGHLKVEGAWQSPSLCLGFSSNKLAALRDYCRLLEQRDAIPKANVAVSQYAWHRQPIVCPWHEQTAVAMAKMMKKALSKAQLESGSFVMDECTQANHKKWVDTLVKNKIPFGTLIIDAKWQKEFGLFEVDKRKWPDMRRFIDDCHKQNIKVMLWLSSWLSDEGIQPSLCTTLDGKPVSMDPTNPEYQKILADGIEYMLSSAPGCLNADGFKIDGTTNIPNGPGVKNYGDVYGFELQHLFAKLVYQKSIEVKKDALVSLFIANPYFRDTCQIVRIGDLYTIYGKPRETMFERADIIKTAMKGKLIDTDGTLRFSVADDCIEELKDQLELGIPCIYQVENLYQNRSFVKSYLRKFTQDDYNIIRSIFTQWIKKINRRTDHV